MGTAKLSQQFPQGWLADMKTVRMFWKREEELKKKDTVRGTQNRGEGGVHGSVEDRLGGSKARVQRWALLGTTWSHVLGAQPGLTHMNPKLSVTLPEEESSPQTPPPQLPWSSSSSWD